MRTGTARALSFNVEVQADVPPVFAQTVADQVWIESTAITALKLPAAEGGNGSLSYTFGGTLPSGLEFDAPTRTISGTPARETGPSTVSWTVSDADGDIAALSFTVTVEEDTAPTFGSQTVANQAWLENEAITALELPAATGGNGTLTYSYSPSLPVGLSLDAATRTISGTPTAGADKFTLGWTATDANGDSATLTFTIEVEDDIAPSFGSETVANQVWTENTAIADLELPAATGGNGTLTYSYSPSMPAGLSLDLATRTISGTPSADADEFTLGWTATDADGDSATLTFTIEVLADTAPSFGNATIADMTFTNGVEFFTKTSDVSTYGLPAKRPAATGRSATPSRLRCPRALSSPRG